MVISVSPIPAVNVAAVPQRSPLRYPGGKTWLIPHIRVWLRSLERPGLLVEPFAGGAIVSLTAVMENLVDEALMIELDKDVAALWKAALNHGPELAARISSFNLTRESVIELSRQCPADIVEHGFRTLVLNRTRRGGILANGASFTRKGENGAGIASRWYPNTLIRRLRAIAECAPRITFCETDGIQILDSLLGQPHDDVAIFVDPPYTGGGGKRAGKRLYAHNDIDHARLFSMLAESNANFLMTYDRSLEIESLIESYKFTAVQVVMKSGHHARLPELVITRYPCFSKGMSVA
ncbi:MAG: DNA adenine methylase [Anaerolineae bacterium]|nr:DNA adenine methylase [Anaerolineae bacterium]